MKLSGVAVVRQYSNLPGKIECKQVTLSYSNATSMRGYTLFSGRVLCAVATMEARSATPTANTDNVYVETGFGGTASRVEIYTKGSGYVSGHSLAVNIMAIIEA